MARSAAVPEGVSIRPDFGTLVRRLVVAVDGVEGLAEVVGDGVPGWAALWL